MAFAEYICGRCGQTQYVFEGEEHRLPNGKCPPVGGFIPSVHVLTHCFEKQPPRCMIVHATELFMATQLDSIHTIDELDQAATREAEDEREVRQQNAARREL